MRPCNAGALVQCQDGSLPRNDKQKQSFDCAARVASLSLRKRTTPGASLAGWPRFRTHASARMRTHMGEQLSRVLFYWLGGGSAKSRSDQEHRKSERTPHVSRRTTLSAVQATFLEPGGLWPVLAAAPVQGHWSTICRAVWRGVLAVSPVFCEG